MTDMAELHEHFADGSVAGMDANAKFWSAKDAEELETRALEQQKSEGEAREFLRQLLKDPHLFVGEAENRDPRTGYDLPFARSWLHFACVHNATKVAQVLLAEGANVHAQDKDGRAALHFATMNGNRELAEILLEKGAFVFVRDRLGTRPIHIAAEYGYLDLMDLFTAFDANLNVPGPSGFTPLHYCVQRACSDRVLNFLLEHNADLYVKDKYGRTPRELAEVLGLKNVVQRLKDEKEMRRLSVNREAVLKAARQRKNEILIERELKKREKEERRRGRTGSGEDDGSGGEFGDGDGDADGGAESDASLEPEEEDEWWEDDEEKARGYLLMQILQCKDLLSSDGFLGGENDAYCIVRWNHKLIGRTPVVNNSNNPNWHNQYFRCNFPWDRSDCTLSIEVYDRDQIGDDDFLGMIKLVGSEEFYKNKAKALLHVDCKFCEETNETTRKYCVACGKKLKVKTRNFFKLKPHMDGDVIDPADRDNKCIGGKIGIAFRNPDWLDNYEPEEGVPAPVVHYRGDREKALEHDDLKSQLLNGYNDMRAKAEKQMKETADAIYKIPERDLEADMKTAMAAMEQTMEQVQNSDVAKNLTAFANDVANADYSYDGMRDKLDQAADLLDLATERAALASAAAAERAADIYNDAKATVDKVAIEAREKVAAISGDAFPSKWDIARIHQDLEEEERQEQQEVEDEEMEQARERKQEEKGSSNAHADDEAWRSQGYEKYWDEDASAWYWYHSTNGDTHWAEHAKANEIASEATVGEGEWGAEQQQWTDHYSHSHNVSTAWEGSWSESTTAAASGVTDGPAHGVGSSEEWQRVWDETKQMEYMIKPRTGEYYWVTDE